MAAELNPDIHPLNRLKICAALHSAGATDGFAMKFRVLRDLVDLSDATLSKQLGALEAAGHVKRRREYGTDRGKDVVWVWLTGQGVVAFTGHVAALREIAE